MNALQCSGIAATSAPSTCKQAVSSITSMRPFRTYKHWHAWCQGISGKDHASANQNGEQERRIPQACRVSNKQWEAVGLYLSLTLPERGIGPEHHGFTCEALNNDTRQNAYRFVCVQTYIYCSAKQRIAIKIDMERLVVY